MKPILLDLPMPITTPRMIIRPPQLGDGALCNAAIIESFSILQEFMPWAAQQPTIAESEQFVREAAANWILKKCDEPWLPLFMFEKSSNNFIGATGYHHINWDVPCLETGYWIRSSYSGRGLMTEAIHALTVYAFQQLSAKRIAITCDINNTRSKKIPERLNYQLEATMKANRKHPITGELSDTLLYAKYDLAGLPDLDVTW